MGSFITGLLFFVALTIFRPKMIEYRIAFFLFMAHFLLFISISEISIYFYTKPYLNSIREPEYTDALFIGGMLLCASLVFMAVVNNLIKQAKASEKTMPVNKLIDFIVRRATIFIILPLVFTLVFALVWLGPHTVTKLKDGNVKDRKALQQKKSYIESKLRLMPINDSSDLFTFLKVMEIYEKYNNVVNGLESNDSLLDSVNASFNFLLTKFSNQNEDREQLILEKLFEQIAAGTQVDSLLKNGDISADVIDRVKKLRTFYQGLDSYWAFIDSLEFYEKYGSYNGYHISNHDNSYFNKWDSVLSSIVNKENSIIIQ